MNQEKLVILKLQGDLEEKGFAVTAIIKDEFSEPLVQALGSLPPAPYLLNKFNTWISEIHTYAKREEINNQPIVVDTSSSIEDWLLKEEQITSNSRENYNQKQKDFIDSFNVWLTHSYELIEIRTELDNKVSNYDAVRVMIQTNDSQVKKLPWEKWSWLTYENRQGRLFFSPIYQRPPKLSKTQKLRIQIIVGDSTTTQQELDILRRTFSEHEILPELINESSIKVYNCLGERNYDILYFSGHGKTNEDIGRIYINQDEYLEINQLNLQIKKAIDNSLKLAIFNCCQGLGLESELSKNRLLIPNLIIMRDIIHERISQIFLEDLLQLFFIQKNPLHIAISQVYNNLKGYESDYPGSSLMPILFQISEKPQYWEDWLLKDQPNLEYSTILPRMDEVRNSGLTLEDKPNPESSSIPAIPPNSSPPISAIIISLISTSLVIGMRVLGLLQPLEIWAYDQIIRRQPSVLKKDPRILVITIDKEDIDYQKSKGWIGEGEKSLKDEALAKLLDKLEPIKPTTIGVDIYHDSPVIARFLSRFQEGGRIFFICTIRSETNKNGVAPPPNIPSSPWGFNNFWPDNDDIIRRSTLTTSLKSQYNPQDPCKTEYSFPFLLALHYLEVKHKIIHGKDTKEIKRDKHLDKLFDQDTVEGWQIGNAYLPNLKKGMGGYQQFDDGGTQILFNYHYSNKSFDEGFYHIDLKTVLENGIPEHLVELFKNTHPIILIGTVDPNLKDDYRTPYGESIRGIFLNAQVVSYILSVALDKKPPIYWWPIWGDWLWIWLWSIGVVGLRLWIPNRWFLSVTSGIVFLIIPTSGYLIFIYQALWIPIIPPVINAISTTGLLFWWEKKKNIHLFVHGFGYYHLDLGRH
ncbi:MAG: CHASE2 domain-containing protein [Cuspidothrix sp.]